LLRDVNLAASTVSLQRFGQPEPLVVHAQTARVIGGNGRLEKPDRAVVVNPAGKSWRTGDAVRTLSTRLPGKAPQRRAFAHLPRSDCRGSSGPAHHTILLPMKAPALLGRGALLLALLTCTARIAAAQRPPPQLDAAVILHRMHKLGVLGSVLYVAAHPDDENTRLISFLSNGRQVRTAYLSLTRGDGGQNLIGPELGDALGILRTQELLEARRIDGGEQFFTRAVDFGYSKTPEETFAKWGRQEVLGDVVRVVRTFRPDVIITRFPTDGSGGHGHHTASALLAHEAFELAADPRAFPEQLAQGLEPWQAKRLFFNAFSWGGADLAAQARKDPSHWVAIDVGGFDPLLGTSYTEIAGRSRSMHKSQGFGAAETRGEQIEYLRLEKGAELATPDILDGVELSFTRIDGGERAAALRRGLLDSFDPRAPERSLAQLSTLVRVLDELAASKGRGSEWAKFEAGAARQLILQVCGAVIEVTANVPRVAQGDTLKVSLSSMQRRPGPALEVVRFDGPGSARLSVEQPLPLNRPLAQELTYVVGSARAIDQPYWLAAPHETLYRPDRIEPEGIEYTGIEPISRSASLFRGTLRSPDGLELSVDRALMQTWVDRVAGERTRPIVITPVASIEVPDAVAIVSGERASVSVEVQALCDDLSGELKASPPDGWTVEQAPKAVEHLRRGERERLTATLSRTPKALGGTLHFSFEGKQGATDRTLHVIDYPHILPQTWYAPADLKLVPLDVAVSVKTVGYIDGAGDDVPKALQRLGLAVERIDPASAHPNDLEHFDSIVVGIRAYNTVQAMARFNPVLLTYVEHGGTLLVQYNTNGSDLVLDAKKLGPHPFVLTRDRVTVEEAPATFLAPTHPVMNLPNKLGPADFEGWVQERGLYFAGEIDAKYTPLIAWNDPGEKPLNGALITCDFGKGRYTYTGISLFRELPAGVPGAYRLLANLLSRRAPRQ
jgi:LmbE family N-acetylglucosaminyl deacetylase